MESTDVIKELQKGFAPFAKRSGVDQKKIDILCQFQAASLPDEPVKIVDAAKDMGLTVYNATLPEGISGVLSFSDREICVEESDSVERKRFTCAHEVGHFILHEKLLSNDKSWGDIFFRSETTSYLERDANTMAAEILTPSWFVKHFAAHNKTIDDMARIFKVSKSAIDFRITNVFKSPFLEDKYRKNSREITLGREPQHVISFGKED